MVEDAPGPRWEAAHATDCPALARLSEPAVTARLMLVVAHPDDETIGAGGLLLRSTDAHVVVVTDGAPADRALWAVGVNAQTPGEYAAQRLAELRAALAEAGLGPEQLHVLGFADGHVVERIPPLVGHLLDLSRRIDPEVVLTCAYEGAHVDHDAIALAVHTAMMLSGRGHPHEIALYHADDTGIAVHRFLPTAEPVLTCHLDSASRVAKGRMLARYVSQRQYAEYFGTDLERYRCAPAYDFRRPPMTGRLLYARSDSHVATRWRRAADTAIQQMNLPDPDTSEQDAAALGKRSTPTQTTAVPLVSVIVRTTGRATLVQALDSIARQTYPSIELVLVDVAGQGAPPMWQGREGLLLRTHAAHGFDRAAAANVGLAAATGDYLAFLDDDDWYHPGHLACLVAALQKSTHAKVAYAGVEAVECLPDATPRRRWLFNVPYDPVALLCENYIPLNALLVDRRWLQDEGWQFDETLGIYEDWDFLIWLSRRTGFEHLQAVGAVYRWPPGSGVDDPAVTGAAQERIYSKWRATLTDADYIAIVRRAIAQTAINDQRARELEELQQRLKTQEEQFDRAGTVIQNQERQLSELRPHLRALDAEIEQLRARVAAQMETGTALAAELAATREQLSLALAQLAAVTSSTSWRITRPLRKLRTLLADGASELPSHRSQHPRD